jgi:hypothetical protein
MAITNTTISAAVAATDLIIPVTSATGFAAGNWLRIDSEFMQVVSVSGTSIAVRSRGDYGSPAQAHSILAGAATGLTSDLPSLAPTETAQIPPHDPTLISVGADATIDSPVDNSTYIITKATAAAITLNAPSKAQDGLILTFLSATAQAHTVTYTAGFYGDTTSSDVATFAAKVGASMTIIARGGTWGVYALANVTLA